MKIDLKKEFLLLVMVGWAIIASVGLILSNLEYKQLRAAWNARMAADPSHSCVPPGNGERMLCWLEAGVLHSLTLKAGDGIVSRDCLAKRDRRRCAR